MFLGYKTIVRGRIQALKRALGMAKLPDVVVISPGGVATTALIAYLEQFVSVNHRDDFDGLKHLPHPKTNWSSARVIYISPNERAVDTILDSLINRKIDSAQVLKLGGSLRDCLRPVHKRRAILRALIAQQRHTFGSTSGVQLVIDAARLHEAAPEIATFLGITDDRFISDYPIHRRVAISTPESPPHRDASHAQSE